jgi:WD40 repeat protein
MAYEPVLRLPSNSTIDALAFSSKAEWLASGDHKGHLRIFETTTGIERYTFEFDNPITTVVWHPKKNTVFVGLRTGVVAFIQDFKVCLSNIPFDLPHKFVRISDVKSRVG